MVSPADARAASVVSVKRLVLLASSALIACATPVPAGSSSDDVVGGAPDPVRTSTVAIYGPRGYCSGSLVQLAAGRGSVLTAAHCLRGGDPTEVVLADDSAAAYAFRFPVVAAIADPEFDFEAAVSDHDFAMLTIDGIDDSWPIQILADAEEDAALTIGEPIVVSGFGLTEAGGGNNTERRAVTLEVRALSSALITSSAPDQATCGGDSGSPVLVRRGQLEVQVGVHAWGNSECRGEANASRIASARDWIFAQLVR